MGSYNILITDIQCPGCGKKNEAHIQFKYANTWQHKYRIGDALLWSNTRYDLGSASIRRVKAYGIIESTQCTFCNENILPEEYDVFIEDNVLRSCGTIEDPEDYLQYSPGEGCYFVLEE